MKHYGNVHKLEPKRIVQVEECLQRNRRIELSEAVIKLAYKEYVKQFSDSQSFERIQQRGGFSVLEIVGLLADYIERLENFS